LIILRQLAVFCVPAFLFSTGFFVAYAARGNQSQLTWKITLRRIVFILIPYILWSLVWFVFDYSQGSVYTISEYVRRLFLGAANNTYFYVIVICQLYLLSPIIVPLIKKYWKLSLGAAAFILFFSLALRYGDTFGNKITSPLRYLFSLWFISNWLFYFVLGIIVSFHQGEFNRFITKHKWALLILTMALGVISIVEGDIGFRMTKVDWLGPHNFSSSIYVTSFVLCFLAFQDSKVPFHNFFTMLGHNIYGIYLTHWIVLMIVKLFIFENFPMVLSNPLILQSILILFGIGVPVAVMNLSVKAPVRRIYRYVFG
jgi:membrane-bound acyltransferase YfiQ involved in biofilm formation